MRREYLFRKRGALSRKKTGTGPISEGCCPVDQVLKGSRLAEHGAGLPDTVPLASQGRGVPRTNSDRREKRSLPV